MRPPLFRSLLGLALFVALSPAAQGSSACLIRFGALAGHSEPPIELVVGAFRELLQNVRETNVERSDFATAEDPFQINDHKRELFALKRFLAEFHEMVKKKGWDTLAVRGALWGELDRQIAARAKAQGRQRVAIERAWKTRELAIPPGGDVSYSPDHRWAVTRDTNNFFVIEIPTKDIRTAPLPEAGAGSPFFSPQGNFIYFPVKAGLIGMPFANGKVDTTLPPVPIAHPKIVADSNTMVPSSSPHLFFLQRGTQVFLVDSSAQSVRYCPTIAGVIPGTMLGYTFEKKANLEVMNIGTVTKEGEIEFPQPGPSWTLQPAAYLQFSSDKNWVIYPGNGERTAGMKKRDGSATQELISYRTGTPNFGAEVLGVGTHPRRNLAYVILPGANSNQWRIEWIDLATQKGRAETKIPALSEMPTFTNDGTMLGKSLDGTRLVIVNLDEMHEAFPEVDETKP